MQPKKPTLTDVALLAGTSIATVSRVLNQNGYVKDSLKAKVLKSIEDTGYKPKKIALANHQIEKIAVITNDDISNPNSFYYAILAGIRYESKRLGLEIEFLLLDHILLTSKGLDHLLDKFDGVLLVGMENAELLNLLHKLKIPTQIINGYDPAQVFSSISPDYEFGGYLAANHLLENGHENIAIITANLRRSLIERQLGFIRAHREKNMQVGSHQIFDLMDIAKNKQPALYEKIISGEAGGDFGAKKILPSLIEEGVFDSFDGIFCICDMIAISCMQIFKSQQKPFPSFIGFDDLPISSLVTPQLTTIRSNYYDLAKQGLAMLLDKVNYGIVSSIRGSMAVELLERESTIKK